MIQSVRGFSDIHGPEIRLWQKAECIFKSAFDAWGFREVRFPVIEKTELFQRGIGDTTDIVEKEMYTFEDKGGERVTMRPEGTASVIRFFNEHKLYGTDRLFRFYYTCPMFRYERPQKGRLRQFHQTGVEILGDPTPRAEGEALTLIDHLLREFGISRYTLYINSLGCNDCRDKYRDALIAYFDDRDEKLCPDCKRRKSANPMRLLDCKSEHCREGLSGAPKITDYLCGGCAEHHEGLKKILDLYGIVYREDPFIVRGLDYYNRTVFEVHAEGLGAQSAVLAGGRYDGLSAELGGHDIPAVGWAMGMERLVSLLPDGFAGEEGIDVFVIFFGGNAEAKALPAIRSLRRQGVRVDYDLFGGSMKSQFRRADKLSARKVVIIGDDELAAGSFILKDMATGEQKTCPVDNMAENIRKEL